MFLPMSVYSKRCSHIIAVVMWIINYHIELPVDNMVLRLVFKIIIGMFIYIIGLLLMHKTTKKDFKKLIKIL